MTQKKIAIVTCYKDPDYIRARVLRSAFQAHENLEILVVKNKSKGVQRYLEVIVGVIKVRFTQRPDAYVLTFRGYETIPLLQVLVWPKPIVFDEFINLYEWVVQEHKKLKEGSLLARLLSRWWSFILRHCKIILTDTHAHAEYSSKLSGVPLDKYIAVPVGGDETLFKADLVQKPKEDFTVFYYGNMLPLHGLEYVLEAAKQLKDESHISFLLVGGKESTITQIENAQKKGVRITYKPWIPFEELPRVIRDASVCLGGPFGDTIQSQLVVTGKTYQFLACGAPTIVGASKASSDFHDGLDCLIVPQGDANALAQKIRWAHSHQPDLKTIGMRGQALYEERFSNKAIALILGSVVQKLFPA